VEREDNAWRALCAHCGDRIGVYERVVAVDDEG